MPAPAFFFGTSASSIARSSGASLSGGANRSTGPAPNAGDVGTGGASAGIGGTVAVAVHLDCVVLEPTLMVGGTPVLDAGRLVL